MTLKIHHYKISFCVVAMNRLHHLKKTFIKNIHDNANYTNLEFVLLNYNSKDSMDEWVQENLKPYIKSGLVRYYKTNSAASWSPSHSKNIAFKLASGDIVCNIWADYFTGANFANYVNKSFNNNPNIVLTPIDFFKTKNNYSPPGDVLGKVCVRKNDFLKIGGFDERINKHGFEDYDFVNRLEMIGVIRVLIEEPQFLRFVSHEDSERFTLPEKELEAIYVSHLDPNSSIILIMLKNQTFYMATVIDNTTLDSHDSQYAYKKRNYLFDFRLYENDWDRGKWKKDDASLFLSSKKTGESELRIKNAKEIQSHNSKAIFLLLTDKEQITSVLNFRHFHDTRKIMESNLNNRISIVNQGRFGKATLF